MTSAEPRRSTLAMVLLALLLEAPMHPYRMQQMIKERGQDQLVNVAQRNSVYQALDRLEDRDFLGQGGELHRGRRRGRAVPARGLVGARHHAGHVEAFSDERHQRRNGKVGCPVEEDPHGLYALAASSATGSLSTLM